MRRSVVLTGNRMAAVVVVGIAVLALTAVVVSRSVRAAQTASAAASLKDGGQVTAAELSQAILEKRQDYQLVDLREPWHFDDYHIPTAINIPRESLFQPESLKRLDQKKKIIVYSLGAGDGAKAQLLLSMKGYRAYALEDGIIGWWDEIMTPTSIRSAKPSSSGYQQARQLREYFMSGGAVTAAPPPAPAMPAPAAVPARQPRQAAVPAKAAAPPSKKAVTPATKKSSTPSEKKPSTPSEQEKEKLKLGTGCS